VQINPGPDFHYPPPPDVETFLKGQGGGTKRLWRPICERYREFMEEQWALDTQEEEEAKVEAARKAALESLEAEKRAEKEKRRQQAEARKKAKRAAEELPRESVMTLDDDRFGPMAPSAALLTMPEQNRQVLDLGDQVQPLTPTLVSSVNVHDVPSGENFEMYAGEVDDDREIEEALLVHE
jgi:COMPASS component BRE2